MINLSYFDFARNNYYNGKLLSVNDFENEQKYNNDKRRISNRLINGFGVVSGFDVVAVSDDSISIEAGMAIDGYGREIVLGESVVKKFYSINGYERGGNEKEYYLFAEYSEKMSEPVSVSGDNNNQRMFNKIKEQCSVYLLDRNPSADKGEVINYYRNQTNLIEKENLTVILDTPLYIKSSGKFIVKVKIIPKNITQKITVQAKINLTCVRYQKRDYIEMNFSSEEETLNNGIYEKEYICDCMNVNDDIALFEAESGAIKVNSDDESSTNETTISADAVISQSRVENSVVENYSSEIMGYIMTKPCRDICIAKITLESKAPCVIKNIELLPFNQRVYSNAQLALENMVLNEKVDILSSMLGKTSRTNKDIKNEKSDVEISSGETVINIGIGGKAGKRFFSEEISHGLGLGNVSIIVSRADSNDFGSAVIGSGEIFDEDENSIKAESAVKVYKNKGTFVIGLRLIETTTAYEIPVQWTAVRKKESIRKPESKKIIIDGATRSMRIMESAYFTLKFVNMNETRVRWSVENDSCGTINDNGYYTAPNHPGVFEIRVVCAYDESISASAFIVVKP